MSAGYSGTPLVKKLGLKAGVRAWIVGCPLPYEQFVNELPADIEWVSRGSADYIHFFVTRRDVLEIHLPKFAKALVPGGMCWISWPKKAAKVPTDVTEDVLREVILPTGLVDVKVCAVNEVWSGLKFVWRKAKSSGVASARRGTA